ncbi:hypothetical protein I302_102072 [Kwoniella bestiolae CBS 10118]|uniref:DUF1479-domain-containing protein n=1 Tax=Kwoniella bestiolae CBS 10118 TaxID=1296100 RepID=A0A1B9GE71_9TREE|nr:hypothetical protein I302_00757 [Kwoniella bestiolae CBS 10118]OCF29261.1 hypothetical protein I302_00757 [Kwoniella bestiolae CBS 10118]
MLRTSHVPVRALTTAKWSRCISTQTHAEPSRGPSMSMMGMMGSKKEREEGDISSVFASLAGEAAKPLPARFGELKQKIVGDEANQRSLVESWSRLTSRLREVAEEVDRKKQDCIPQITYDDLVSSPTSAVIDSIKTSGSLIVKNVIPRETAERWLEDVKQYIQGNPEVKGFPKDDKQVFELYWSKTQLLARSHPRSFSVQKSLLRLFSSEGSDNDVSLNVPLSYADRLRIRHPGDSQFALGPHSDGGSVERWEDETYRNVYKEILRGKWERFDPWRIGDRVKANQNIYDGPGSCGVFRAFQGWTSLSSTGPNEGTLRVYPFIKELSAYVLLRPLFREKQSRSSLTNDQYLSPSNWELDLNLTSTAFPGSPLARCQEYNDVTHPHLELGRSMVSMPRVEPGDQAWWHCDTIHAVEPTHKGLGPSAVLYIPTVPLTLQNIQYIKDQRENFTSGRPAPDFPGGVGESGFVGRGLEGDVVGKEGRQAMGLEPFDLGGSLSEGERELRRQANEILGF